MTWEKRKSAKKTSFFSVSAHFFSLSLSTASSAIEDPTETFSPPPTNDCSTSPWTQILTGDRGSHREVFPLPSADFLLLLLLLSSSATSSQHCHHFFHQYLRQLHARPATAAPSPPQGCLPLHSTHLQLLQPFGCMQNVNSNCSRFCK